jgi:hypothetical protein
MKQKFYDQLPNLRKDRQKALHLKHSSSQNSQLLFQNSAHYIGLMWKGLGSKDLPVDDALLSIKVGFCSLTNITIPEREPSIAGVPSVQKPTSFPQDIQFS